MPNPAVTATDNCGVPIDLQFTEVEIPGTCSNQYSIKRTWSAQDDCGNSTVFTQTITINDDVKPVLANLPPATVNVACSQVVADITERLKGSRIGKIADHASLASTDPGLGLDNPSQGSKLPVRPVLFGVNH